MEQLGPVMDAINPHYALPIVGVLLCALLVFAFGFKSPSQPPSFDAFLVPEHSRKRRTARPVTADTHKQHKPHTNGHTTGVPPGKNLSTAKRQAEGSSTGVGEKESKPKKIESKPKKSSTVPANERQDRPGSDADSPPGVEDADEGDWVQLVSRKERKNRKKDEAATGLAVARAEKPGPEGESQEGTPKKKAKKKKEKETKVPDPMQPDTSGKNEEIIEPPPQGQRTTKGRRKDNKEDAEGRRKDNKEDAEGRRKGNKENTEGRRKDNKEDAEGRRKENAEGRRKDNKEDSEGRPKGKKDDTDSGRQTSPRSGREKPKNVEPVAAAAEVVDAAESSEKDEKAAEPVATATDDSEMPPRDESQVKTKKKAKKKVQDQSRTDDTSSTKEQSDGRSDPPADAMVAKAEPAGIAKEDHGSSGALASSNVVFDELGDVLQDSKAQKKKKKVRRE